VAVKQGSACTSTPRWAGSCCPGREAREAPAVWEFPGEGDVDSADLTSTATRRRRERAPVALDGPDALAVLIATDWPGGIYASPRSRGRAGGPVARRGALKPGRAGLSSISRAARSRRPTVRGGHRNIPELCSRQQSATIVCWARRTARSTCTASGRMEARVAGRRQQRPLGAPHRNGQPHADSGAVHRDCGLRRQGAARSSARESGNAPMYGMMAKAPLAGSWGKRAKVMEAMYGAGAVVRGSQGRVFGRR